MSDAPESGPPAPEPPDDSDASEAAASEAPEPPADAEASEEAPSEREAAEESGEPAEAAEPEPAPEEPEPVAPVAERELASVVPISRHEEIAGICGRIDVAPTLAVVLHAPSGNRAMAEELGMQRVVRHVRASGRVLAVATRSGTLARRARAQGVPVSWNPRKVHWGSGGKVVIGMGPLTVLVPPFGRYASYLALALFVLAVAAALFTAGPSAAVTVYPPTTTVEGLAVVRVSPRIDEVDLERLMVPATVVAIEREVLLAVPATREMIQGVTPATATLRIANPTASAVAVPAGAVVFSSPGFVAFEVDVAVNVPAGGNAFAPVTARSPGVGGNVAAETITQWRSTELAVLTATNPDAATGGTDAPRRAVAPADIRALESLAEAIGQGTPPAELLAGARPGYGIIVRSATVTVALGEPSAQPGEVADAVYMEVRTTIEALAIPPEALETLARALLESPGGLSELVPGAVLAAETGERQIDHPDGSFTSEIRLTAEFPEGPTPDEVADAVMGLSPEAAEAELGTRYALDDVEIDLTPGWAPRLPRFGFRLDVRFASRAFEPQQPETESDAESDEPDAEASPTDGP